MKPALVGYFHYLTKRGQKSGKKQKKTDDIRAFSKLNSARAPYKMLKRTASAVGILRTFSYFGSVLVHRESRFKGDGSIIHIGDGAASPSVGRILGSRLVFHEGCISFKHKRPLSR